MDVKETMHLHYRGYGDGGPALIILHGMLGESGNWHTLSNNAFDELFCVYAVDQRNHGRSPHSDVMNFAVMADDLLAFMDEHDIQAAHVHGHSMGGKTAMQFALTYPDRVTRLVVADMTPMAYEARHTRLLEALLAIDPTAYASREDIDAALADDIPSTPIRRFLLKNLTYDGDTETYRWQLNLKGIYENYDRLTAPIEAEQPFEKPALFVRGETSDYVTDEDEACIKELFPRAEIVTLEGAGHWLHAERPEAYARLVLDFLKA